MLYIVRGLPGSGKSTLAKKIASSFKISHFERDMYFTDENGLYKFDKKLFPAADEWCIRQGLAELYCGNSVVISNVFMTFAPMEDYVHTAERVGIPITVIECTESYGSVHNVPVDIYEKMKKHFQPNDKLGNMGDIKLVTAKEFYDVHFTDQAVC